ncbi:hypothetical protein [Litoribrevibacter albus]|uniref:Uncharacterized protein n=1 Tax=Litoribrevibacter albus TaxID=1473156 RepID=A0AA37SAM4_9GAMM|nr:hypothetical protein [Litoribrevibacter albus]GLQ31636.1 hypothetical protein GCM10007876_21150 [Litoribrevibacter albus]
MRKNTVDQYLTEWAISIIERTHPLDAKPTHFNESLVVEVVPESAGKSKPLWNGAINEPFTVDLVSRALSANMDEWGHKACLLYFYPQGRRVSQSDVVDQLKQLGFKANRRRVSETITRARTLVRVVA